MMQPDIGERSAGPGDPARGTGPGRDGPGSAAGAGAGSSRPLPPGQYIPAAWPVLHYGRTPVFRPDSWDLKLFGATADGQDHRWDWAGFAGLPRQRVVADFHCVTKFSIPGVAWEGVPTAALLQAVPPTADVTHVMVWADYGYSANLRIADFVADETLLATHRNGAELTPERGYPVRLVVPGLYAWKSVKWVRAIEYLTRDRRGFWEERGYHNVADPWREQRYSYQERPGEGPPP
jgi:DMSO/TMAO reductase YedYZ molybdopterin-dependent catalytic subunit